MGSLKGLFLVLTKYHPPKVDKIMPQNMFLSLEQQREIQNKTGWSDNVISHIRSIEETAIYIKTELVGQNVVGGGHF